jgi:L-ascorbate metabolism protein UlaG (beta-lactamase superfamily)
MRRKFTGILYFIIIMSAPAFALSLSSDKEPGITLYYGENAQFEIVSPGGIHVYIDVHNPAVLSKKGVKKDILLTTHHHPDHFTYAMTDAFKGLQLDVKIGTLTSGDVKVTGIASGHNAGDTFLDQFGTNYIYIIETAGLRIAHFGDIGQNELTKEQLAVLGKIDIAMTQFENTWSDMDVENKKGFKLMEQLKPRFIIPTHVGSDGVALLGKNYDALFSKKNPVKISKDSIPEKVSVLFLGGNAVNFGGMTKGKEIE